jgi:hypothetical protein
MLFGRIMLSTIKVRLDTPRISGVGGVEGACDGISVGASDSVGPSVGTCVGVPV